MARPIVIEVQDYDPVWPSYAARAIDEVRAALAGLVVAIEHIGSTAVPGLAAKPVIDLMAAAPSVPAVESASAALAAIGFDRSEPTMPNRLFYRREGAPVAYHLHIVDAASWETRNQRLLRDHLRENAVDRAAYGDLKRALAASADEGDAYTKAKTALIQRMVDSARTARGLPLVNVWEE
ncbi:GrpB family protein [Asanoa sp. WMMD1127]|uniref:GrpB family protein n=1 Tax=Asanoa sp. WMMD1127 TaxID=3016107 RepID=UPI0024167E8A|nr:GrpB family protein [Asanoa sp. WMMD1127]MDG4823859.1 GrpB family protein [Asanoa sp. WMMD1127]